MDYDTENTTDTTEYSTGYQQETTENNDDYIKYLKKINDNINLYYPIVLIIVGFTGNCVSFAVYSRNRFAKSVTGFYFRCLSIF